MDIKKVSKSRITPEKFLACIEISAGSKCKYEFDKETGGLILDRILYTATHYPYNYGFVPRTLSEDGDPLDVMVITSAPMLPLSSCMCYPIGLLEMEDGGKVDEKIIAVCAKDPLYSEVRDIKDLPDHVTEEIKHFFMVYKELEHGKTTVVKDMLGVEDAKECISRCITQYEDDKIARTADKIRAGLK